MLFLNDINIFYLKERPGRGLLPSVEEVGHEVLNRQRGKVKKKSKAVSRHNLTRNGFRKTIVRRG